MDEMYEYLMQIRRAELSIRRLEMKAAALRTCLLPNAIRYDKDRVQTSPEDKLAEIMADIDGLERDIIQRKEEKAGLIQEITGAIDRLEDEREKTVLTGFFVNRESMSEVAEEIRYSSRSTYRFRKWGMQHLASILANMAKTDVV
jgi:DNA-directed RNA polymerase specialized sigma subunit